MGKVGQNHKPLPAQRETAQMAATWPKPKRPPCRTPTEWRWPSGSPGLACGRWVRVSRVRARVWVRSPETYKIQSTPEICLFKG